MRTAKQQQELFKVIQQYEGHALGLTYDGMLQWKEFVEKTVDSFIDHIIASGEIVASEDVDMIGESVDYCMYVNICKKLPEFRAYVANLNYSNKELAEILNSMIEYRKSLGLPDLKLFND